MSNIVELPNGSSWDNDLAFADQTDLAKYYMMETLKLALLNDNSVEICDLIVRNPNLPKNRNNLAYKELRRDGLVLTSSKFYTHQKWKQFILTGEMISDQDFFDEEQWSSSNAKFEIREL